jgi:hypothetical protein
MVRREYTEGRRLRRRAALVHNPHQLRFWPAYRSLAPQASRAFVARRVTLDFLRYWVYMTGRQDERIPGFCCSPGIPAPERQKRLCVTPGALTAQLAAQCLPDPIEPIYVARMALFLA